MTKTMTLDEIAAGYRWGRDAQAQLGAPFSHLNTRATVLVVSDRYVGCNKCEARSRQNEVTRKYRCIEMPGCTGVGFVEDTKKNRVKVVAAILAGGHEPGYVP